MKYQVGKQLPEFNEGFELDKLDAAALAKLPALDKSFSGISISISKVGLPDL